MVQRIGPEELNVTFKFGGGLHTRASPDEIDGHEAAGGQNFQLDIQNRNLRSRAPFDVILRGGPGIGACTGAASLLKTDGTVTTIFQIGTTVIQWFGGTNFAVLPVTANANARFRGNWKEHVWNLTDVVLITDLALVNPVVNWDGASVNPITFTDQAGNPFGNFFAKYCNVVNERAIFSNVVAGVSKLPHLIVGSEQSLYTQITTANTPTSALGVSDPFFIPTPDLKPINGAIQTYLGSMISTERGEIFNLVGTDSTNFAFNSFYANSGAAGSESICEIGNDFIYGRPGRIESIRDTNTFGNSEASDLTEIISDQLSGHNLWTIVFNSRTRKVYCFPTGFKEVWVLDAAMRDAGGISPWSRWTTSHPLGFQPTMVMSLLDPTDGLEYIIMGGSDGSIYRMEGTGANGDGGFAPIDMQFQTKLVSARLDELEYEYEGYIKYQPVLSPVTVNLSFQYQGESLFTNSISVNLATGAQTAYYGGNFYYGGNAYYGMASGRLTRSKLAVPGYANEFQLFIETQSNASVVINEIGLRMRAAGQ